MIKKKQADVQKLNNVLNKHNFIGQFCLFASLHRCQINK